MLKKSTSLPTDKTNLVQRDFALLEAEEFLNVLLAQRLLLVTGAAGQVQPPAPWAASHQLLRQGTEDNCQSVR